MVELMIVIAVISILVTIIMPKMIQTRVKSKLEGCKANLKNIAVNLEMYANDNKGYYQPSNFMALNTSHPLYTCGYLRTIPLCPGRNSGATYSYGIDAYAAGQLRTYLVYCYTSQGGHADSGLGTNFPRYDSARGYLYN